MNLGFAKFAFVREFFTLWFPRYLLLVLHLFECL